MTVQLKLKATLENAGIPYKEINCYGRQIVITSRSSKAANKWAVLLAKFATVRGVVKASDEAKENKKTVLNPSVVKVWRTFATI